MLEVTGLTITASSSFAHDFYASVMRRGQERDEQAEVRVARITALVIGAIAMMPLFAGAGALMLPTVIGGGLAYTRIQWHPIIRSVCLLVATAPVVIVGSELVGSFGWSLRSATGFAIMLAVYAAIIWAARFTMSPQLDGWRPNRWLTIIVPLGVGLLFFTMIIGG